MRKHVISIVITADDDLGAMGALENIFERFQAELLPVMGTAGAESTHWDWCAYIGEARPKP